MTKKLVTLVAMVDDNIDARLLLSRLENMLCEADEADLSCTEKEFDFNTITIYDAEGFSYKDLVSLRLNLPPDIPEDILNMESV